MRISAGSHVAASGPSVGVPLRCAISKLSGVDIARVSLSSVKNVSTGAVIYLLLSDIVNTFKDCAAANDREKPVNYERRYLSSKGRYDWRHSESRAVRSLEPWLTARRLAGEAEGIDMNITITIPPDTSVNDTAASAGTGAAVIAVQQASAVAIAATLATSFSSGVALANMSDFAYFLGAASSLNLSAASFVFSAPDIILPSAKQLAAPAAMASVWSGGVVAGVVMAVISLLLCCTIAAIFMRRRGSADAWGATRVGGGGGQPSPSSESPAGCATDDGLSLRLGHADMPVALPLPGGASSGLIPVTPSLTPGGENRVSFVAEPVTLNSPAAAVYKIDAIYT
jgi:hypothetical protein